MSGAQGFGSRPINSIGPRGEAAQQSGFPRFGLARAQGGGAQCGLARPTAHRRGYTFGMKTAVSIPDDLFYQADALANRLGKSRSEVYREALADYVARRQQGAVTRALDVIADELSAERDSFADEAARQALERSEW